MEHFLDEEVVRRIRAKLKDKRGFSFGIYPRDPLVKVSPRIPEDIVKPILEKIAEFEYIWFLRATKSAIIIFPPEAPVGRGVLLEGKVRHAVALHIPNVREDAFGSVIERAAIVFWPEKKEVTEILRKVHNTFKPADTTLITRRLNIFGKDRRDALLILSFEKKGTAERAARKLEKLKEKILQDIYRVLGEGT